MQNELRKQIVNMIVQAGEGHIPSAFSIIEIISALYDKILKIDPRKPDWKERDYFILSKGHGCAALYVVLEKHGFISKADLSRKSKIGGILGGHPDMTKVPGVEASTGSLGHGLPFAMGIALGLKIRKMANRVFVLIGDGESHEGTVWETALVASHLKLGNLCCVVDNNKSAEQILPLGSLTAKWKAFGWEVREMDGHSEDEILETFNSISFGLEEKPKVVIADTVKGKGVPFLEGHGVWHYKIPNEEELKSIMETLS